MDDLLRRLGRRILDLRTQHGWSQEEAAWHLRVHRTYMGHLERGEKNVSFATLVKVSAGLGVTVAEMLKGLESGEAESKPTRRKRATAVELDRSRILRQLETLQETVDTLKEIISPVERDGTATPPKRKRQPIRH